MFRTEHSTRRSPVTPTKSPSSPLSVCSWPTLEASACRQACPFWWLCWWPQKTFRLKWPSSWVWVRFLLSSLCPSFPPSRRRWERRICSTFSCPLPSLAWLFCMSSVVWGLSAITLHWSILPSLSSQQALLSPQDICGHSFPRSFPMLSSPQANA